MEKKTFKRLFPHITKEMEKGTSKVDLDVLKETSLSIEPKDSKQRKYAGYQPTAVDFIRRCKTIKQAEEIIDYLKNKGDIQQEEEQALRKQLKDKGLRSFGPRKEPGFYK